MAVGARHRSGTGSSPRSGRRCGTGCGSRRSGRRRPAWCRVVIGGRHLDELRAESGQFFRWRFLTRDLWWASSPYSLSAPPRPDRLRITVKATRRPQRARCAGCRPGTRVVAEGPYGALTAVRAAPAQGAADRRRGRHHPAARAVRVAARRARRPHPDLPGRAALRDVVFRRELEQLAAAPRRQAVVRRRQPRRAGRRPAERRRADPAASPASPTTTSTCAGRRT